VGSNPRSNTLEQLRHRCGFLPFDILLKVALNTQNANTILHQMIKQTNFHMIMKLNFKKEEKIEKEPYL
jgi:hypothetical protein